MTLVIISIVRVKRAGSVRSRLRIDFISTRDISSLNRNKCLFISLISVIFIKILAILI